MKVTPTIVGREVVTARVGAIKGRLREELRGAISNLAGYLVEYIRARKLQGPRPQFLEVDTGRLWRSISYERRETENGLSVLIGTSVVSPRGFPYGKYWETSGARHGGPRPFLKPALEDNRERIRDTLQAAIGRAVAQ